MDIKKFTEYANINENFYIPNIKLDVFLNDVEYANDKHILAITSKYNTYKQFVAIENKKLHSFKVNDVTGDLLNNNRVIMNVQCFHSYEVDKIRDNIVAYCISNFYSELPQQITVFGVTASPVNLIDKDNLKKLFNDRITKELAIKIISVVSGYAYDGIQNEYFLWKKGE